MVPYRRDPSPSYPPSYPWGPVDDRNPDGTVQCPPIRSSSPSPIPLPSKEEREGYYYGLPVQSPLLARTSTAAWDPLGPDGCQKKKALRCAGNLHELHGNRDSISSEIVNILKTRRIRWNHVAFWRIGYKTEYDDAYDYPLILWIGVNPGILTGLTDEDGSPLPEAGKVAVACKQVLEKYDIFDVDCEIREVWSIQTCSESEEPAKTSKKQSKRSRRRK